jgi:hypothetical protein
MLCHQPKPGDIKMMVEGVRNPNLGVSRDGKAGGADRLQLVKIC